MDKRELGGFLRSRRERLRPEDVGLTRAPRRRTPGLRREEVAVLANISPEYYRRLEQGRASGPSSEVAAGIRNALRLTETEAAHLYILAGTAPVTENLHRRDVQASVLSLVNELPQKAAIVTSATLEILAWNDMAATLMEDFGRLSISDRNLARRAFLAPVGSGPILYGVSDVADFRRYVVMELRVTAAKYPTDPEVSTLIDELLAGSDEFAALWSAHDVRVAPELTKTLRHPDLGVITVNCETLSLADRDQQIVLFTVIPELS
jgi:transcriptional regulator with XRE-family HTH domain